MCSIFASNMLSFYQMSKDKVNSGYCLTDSSSDNDGEGLHVLARMIARRLARKSNADRRCHPPGPLSGGGDKKPGLQSPENNDDRKKAATPSGCRPDIPDTVTKEGDGDD